MASTLKLMRALGDATRLRIILLLERDELSVNELQEITRMGQSRISTHLKQLQDAEVAGCWIELVKRALAFAARLDHLGVLKLLQMCGDGGLAHAGDLLQLVD